MVQKIIIAGASITSSPWFTWADYLKDESGLPTVDLSRKGVGNEYIINSLVQNQKHLGPDSLVVMMLTNIDKWDVFVEGQRFDDLLGQKHAPIPIGSRSGFWCTGSWFPDYKKAYDELYYNVDYFCSRTIQMIMLARSICSTNGSRLEIFYDSDIWNYTEQQLYHSLDKDLPSAGQYLSGDLSKIWATQLQVDDLKTDTDSLISFCWHNDLPWANGFYKIHPPSSSHWRFYQSVMRPRIHTVCELRDSTDQMLDKIHTMDTLWQKS